MKGLPLFAELSDEAEDDAFTPDVCEEDDFILDCDILPTTPALTASSYDESKATSDFSVPRNLKSPQATGVFEEGRDSKETGYPTMNDDDDLNALDAWLNSGAVEIVGA